MTTPDSEPRATAHAWLDALQRADAASVLDLSADDIQLVGPRGTAVGRAVLEQWLAGTRIRLQNHREYVDGEWVVLGQRAVWLSPEDGEPLGDAEVASVVRVEDHRVTLYARLDDLAAALSLAGLDESHRL